MSPLELEVLNAALALQAGGQSAFYGYQLATCLEEEDGAYRRTGFSNLYRTLERLESKHLLASNWDLAGPRPRRVYRLVGSEGGPL